MNNQEKLNLREFPGFQWNYFYNVIIYQLKFGTEQHFSSHFLCSDHRWLDSRFTSSFWTFILFPISWFFMFSGQPYTFHSLRIVYFVPTIYWIYQLWNYTAIACYPFIKIFFCEYLIDSKGSPVLRKKAKLKCYEYFPNGTS